MMTKKKSKPKGTMGRPRIEIDFKVFEKLCFFQSTLEEIAGWFKCCLDTIETRVKEHYKDDEGKGRTFSDVSSSLRGGGKISIRRKQFQRALGGSDKMLIHLGKQYLGQTEKQEVEVTQKGPLVIVKKGKEADDNNRS
jgi:hypothetical protein